MTGKKASANPLETALRACRCIAEAIVFGSERPALGVLVAPVSASVATQDILDHIQTVNRSSAAYALILEELVIVLSQEQAALIPKTSKGTIIRPKALVVFADLMNDAYRRFELGHSAAHVKLAVADDIIATSERELKDQIRTMVSEALRRQQKPHVNGARMNSISDDDDLFNAGIDSIRAMSIRSELQRVSLIYD